MSANKIANVLVSSTHGTLITSRFDYHTIPGGTYGVGYEILETSCFQIDEIKLIKQLIDCRRNYYQRKLFFIDCGANIGVHTIEISKHLSQNGFVLAIEAQEWIFYALAGNIAINNCFNTRAINAAVGSKMGKINVPQPDYTTASSFGSLEIIDRTSTEFIGQSINYTSGLETNLINIDSLIIDHIDFIKIDVEGMEIEVLEGAVNAIMKSAPIMLIERIKTDSIKLLHLLTSLDYLAFDAGMNVIAIHKSDPIVDFIKINYTEIANISI